MKKIDWFLLIFLLILIILTPIILLNSNFADNFNISNWLGSEQYASMNYWTIIGFLIIVSILGALVPIPIPYIIPAAVVANAYYTANVDNLYLKLVGIVLFAGLGNSLGDFLDYIIGNGAGHAMSKDQPDVTDKWSQRILKRPKAIPITIVLFGLTPLPDSLLLVPLGLVKYPVKKTLIWMYVGKVGMFFFTVVLGILSLQWVIDNMGESSGPTGTYYGIGLLYLMWLIVFLMAKWDTLFKKKGDKGTQPPEE